MRIWMWNLINVFIHDRGERLDDGRFIDLGPSNETRLGSNLIAGLGTIFSVLGGMYFEKLHPSLHYIWIPIAVIGVAIFFFFRVHIVRGIAWVYAFVCLLIGIAIGGAIFCVLLLVFYAFYQCIVKNQSLHDISDLVHRLIWSR